MCLDVSSIGNVFRKILEIHLSYSLKMSIKGAQLISCMGMKFKVQKFAIHIIAKYSYPHNPIVLRPLPDAPSTSDVRCYV